MQPRLRRPLASLLTPLLIPLLGLSSLALPGEAAAITITLDGGTFDPNPPPGLTSTPSVYEAGALYEGFWYDDAGTPGAVHNIGHTHVTWSDFAYSLIDNPHSWRDGMQGARISLLDGSAFRVVSIDYRVRERLPSDGADPASQFARLPWSYAWNDVQLLLAENPDPVTPDFASFEAQWTAFAIDSGSEFDLGGGLTDPYRTAVDEPWRTIQLTGFDNVTEIFIGHTGAHVSFDNIVIAPVSLGGSAAPEPGTAVLLGTGLVLLASRRRAG